MSFISNKVISSKIGMRFSNSLIANFRHFSCGGMLNLPPVFGEPLLTYKNGSKERGDLRETLSETMKECLDIPCIINGKEYRTGIIKKQFMPTNHKHEICTYHMATEKEIKKAITGALEAKEEWERVPFEDKCAIFNRAAYLTAAKRAKICSAVMLGTGKNLWQAEIDAAAETIDFLRFAPYFAKKVYDLQPLLHTKGSWNRSNHRPLDGFVTAITPFNFCAIGINLVATPAIMGNVCIWKPSSTSILGNYMMYQILIEAGLPPGVINFIPCQGKLLKKIAFSHKKLAGVHFTGSSAVFDDILKTVGNNIEKYDSYPRIVGETGGKNFHFVHASANMDNVLYNTIRSAFEYQGQKCSAASRLYIPKSVWPDFRKKLVTEVKKIKVGQPYDFDVFMTAVIDRNSYENAKSYIEFAKQDKDCEVIVGGECDDKKGFFVQPTIVVTKDYNSKMLNEEIFAPILTVYTYSDNDYIDTLKVCAKTSKYGLTGSIFAKEQNAIRKALYYLRNSAGNFYINDRSTGAIVGEQPFGGARKSGTNDKAGSVANYYRWVSSQTIKESFIGLNDWKYPHMY